MRDATEHSEHHTSGRAFLHDSLRLLTDAHRAYARSGDADRRLANQAFYTRLDITDDEQLRPRLAEPFATIFREAHAVGAHPMALGVPSACARGGFGAGNVGIYLPVCLWS